MSKTVSLNPQQTVVALDSSQLKTFEDLVNLIRGMKIQVPKENYEQLPPEIKKLFQEVSAEKYKNNFL